MSDSAALLDERQDENSVRNHWLKKLPVKVALVVLLVVSLSLPLMLWADSSATRELQPLVRVGKLPEDSKLHPGRTHHRLILLGDIHGMFNEMEFLLDKVEYNKNKDTLVFLGDLITRGYDSLSVLDFAIKNGAYCVRGNHEDEIMSLYAEKHRLKEPLTYPPYASSTTLIAGSNPTGTLTPTRGPLVRKAEPAKPTATPEAWLDSIRDVGLINAFGSFGKYAKKRDRKLVKALKRRHISYIQNCPAMLQLGIVNSTGIEGVAAHAGLLWHEKELELQDVFDVIRMRALVPPDYKHGSEKLKDGEPWFKRWNEAQKSLPNLERIEVFYGHDASTGLNLLPYSNGLDSKCQRGGKLTAMVLTIDDQGNINRELVQIKCKKF